mmetsp:Transcript_8719/g.26804  ORF Transcript_8719/g.26804 Transcript_8719/m.26804 type:complete len:293 (+) Transcript_8719:665-1543(+)
MPRDGARARRRVPHQNVQSALCLLPHKQILRGHLLRLVLDVDVVLVVGSSPSWLVRGGQKCRREVLVVASGGAGGEEDDAIEAGDGQDVVARVGVPREVRACVGVPVGEQAPRREAARGERLPDDNEAGVVDGRDELTVARDSDAGDGLVVFGGKEVATEFVRERSQVVRVRQLGHERLGVDVELALEASGTQVQVQAAFEALLHELWVGPDMAHDVVALRHERLVVAFALVRQVLFRRAVRFLVARRRELGRREPGRALEGPRLFFVVVPEVVRELEEGPFGVLALAPLLV